MDRVAEIFRETKETKVKLSLNLDGTGKTSTQTGVGFFDHMLELLGRHSLIDLAVQAEGDLQVDSHHTVEDVGIVLGQALDKALGDKRGIFRYGWAIVPMDETLAQVAIDLSGRPAFVYNVKYFRWSDREFSGGTGGGVLQGGVDQREAEFTRQCSVWGEQSPYRRGDLQSDGEGG